MNLSGRPLPLEGSALWRVTKRGPACCKPMLPPRGALDRQAGWLRGKVILAARGTIQAVARLPRWAVMNLRRYSPDELLAKYRAARGSISAEDFFSKPAYKKIQELWCAAHFSMAYSAFIQECWVHIADRDLQTDTDFELEVRGVLHPFQITEVQLPGRRRGDEYRGKAPPAWEQEDYSEGSEKGASWVRAGIDKKFSGYGGSVTHLNLLVYLNFPAWDQQFHDMRDATGDVARKFASVWLLNGNALCTVAPNPSLEFSAEGWLMIPETLREDD